MQNSPPSTGTRDAATLITGATGMVGSAVLARLLRSDHPCAVVVRARDQAEAVRRIESLLLPFETAWNRRLPRPTIFRGDLLSDQIGLDDGDIEWIRNECDAVLHSAASLSFAPAVDDVNNEPYRTNVVGTERLSDLAIDCKIRRFYHVSTAYVCGTRSGRVRESDLECGQVFANDYEQSKVQAEQLLARRWLSQDDRKLTVFRPSIVIDPIGLTPVSGDRTIYGAHSLFTMLVNRFGLPSEGEWMRNLGFEGTEKKNLVDVHWLTDVIASVVSNQHVDDWVSRRTFHLTAESGTAIHELDKAFRESIVAPTTVAERPLRENAIDDMAAPFVETFKPYFRNDPVFDREQVDQLLDRLGVPQPPVIDSDVLGKMISNWASSNSHPNNRVPRRRASTTTASKPKESAANRQSSETNGEAIVLSGFEVRLPGGVKDCHAFESLLYGGRSAIGVLPKDRLDRELYFDSRPGVPGKTYTEIGGWVDETGLDIEIEERIRRLGCFDITHRQFAHVAAAALRASLNHRWPSEVDSIDLNRAGVFVGHSGGTAEGGSLALATLAEAASRFLLDPDTDSVQVSSGTRRFVRNRVVEAIREGRPQRDDSGGPHFNAYAAASLTANLLGFRGRREVIDAACSSSLVALQHASSAIRSGALDLAVVGGATYNNCDNLALFSQTQACSASGSYPFDQRASGLVSSEGYVAVVLAKADIARTAGLPILAELVGVGISSDGKGKGLWAPRQEGQTLAIRRATKDKPLAIDYLECHATSTQVGDATELESLKQLQQGKQTQLRIGSVKSNLGHLLEAAGLVGLVKCLIAMRRGEIPPSINFEKPNQAFDWAHSNLRVVDRTERWPSSDDRPKIAAVDAFGIGGLNAHAIIKEISSRSAAVKSNRIATHEPLAIVGRGVVLPGALNVTQLRSLLENGHSMIGEPPVGRWPREVDANTGRHVPIGVDPRDGNGLASLEEFKVPNCRGGYIQDFQFDAQSYRIPPKLIANANPAQLMLIEAVRQAADERDHGKWELDRKRTSVVIGTMFGGQFSNELQIGLRIPELAEKVRRAAEQSGMDPQNAKTWASIYAEQVLGSYPALLDETGGFTASTLASRIARTFDLMGGACAVDADEASSGLAVLNAAHQLSSRQVDLVICGTAGRAMDLVAYDQLYRNGNLAHAGNQQGRYPCEGVAVVMLERLSDAESNGRTVLGVIEGYRESFSPADDLRDPASSISHQIGHLGGGQGLVDAIVTTVKNEESVEVRETASDGYQIRYDVRSKRQTTTRSVTTLSNEPSRRVSSVELLNSSHRSSASNSSGVLSVCLEDDSAEGLLKQLEALASSSMRDMANASSLSSYKHRAVVVASTSEQLARSAAALIREASKRKPTEVDVRSRRFCRVANHAAFIQFATPDHRQAGNRSAWLFPGQGSQYAGIPKAFELDSKHWESIDRFDQELTSLGLETLRDRLSDPLNLLGKDIWWTQAWVLATNIAIVDAMRSRGLGCDVVLGHSFGECTAAWASGVLTLRDVIRFTRFRSEAVSLHGGAAGSLLSVRGEPSQVQSVLRECGSGCTITHHNAPKQTVIAGSEEEIASANDALRQAGLASVKLAVPAPFHTPRMKAARDILRLQQSCLGFLPPRNALLSSISNRYLAEPDDLRENLVDQLVKPVGFSTALNRLADDGCDLLVETGPNNVLTGLALATVGDRSLCISADDPSLDAAVNREFVRVAVECVSGSNKWNAVSLGGNPRLRSDQQAVDDADAKPFEIIDVTRRGRRQRTVGTNLVEQATEPMHDHPEPVTAVEDATDDPRAPVGLRDDTARTIRAETAKAFLFDLVIDLTGYEPDIVDFDADLEAELGIDSIKKAQMIGELVQWADLDLTPDDIRLGQFDSMNDILSLIPADDLVPTDGLGSANGHVPASGQVSASHVDGRIQAGRDESIHEVSDDESLERLMIDLVVDQTGYEESIIDLDADLEGELGIDSIKRAQLLGELEQQYDLPPLQQSDLKIADFPTLRSIRDFILDQERSKKKTSEPVKSLKSSDGRKQPAVPKMGTHRFTLRLAPADRLEGMPSSPSYSGDAVILGKNALANALAARLRDHGVTVHRLEAETIDELDAELDRIWSKRETPHLFLTTAHDSDAVRDVFDANAFELRQSRAIEVPYRLCQRWMQRMIDLKRMDSASLITLLRSGGDFGLGMDQRIESRSTESGALAGLTKAMLIEAWMRGHRDTPMLVIDRATEFDHDREFLEQVWREWATPSYEEEVAFAPGQRSSLRAHHAPIKENRNSDSLNEVHPSRGGTWLIAGGGRGITAMASMALAEKYGLKLHLLGMADPPSLDEETREFAKRDLMGLRRKTMRDVQAKGESPVKYWRRFEKAIEIDATLRECEQRGIAAKYHSVDISNFRAVQRLVDVIRREDGPIRGVIQGAGSGQDARFDRKRPEKVRQCFAAKVDGTIALAAATRDDPLEWFVGFGSISGRFGANGHTDYSAANEMLAKLIGQLRRQRNADGGPVKTKCMTFHWHAWGDVGMATKPEAKLALEMIGMEFMPASDGLHHFLVEFEGGGDVSEVLITDRRYVRKFIPAGEDDRVFAAPMIMRETRRDEIHSSGQVDELSVTLDPYSDLFLKEHLVGDRPTLPIVVALEMLAQAASLDRVHSGGKWGRLLAATNVRALQPLKCVSDDAFAIELLKESDSTNSSWSLACDLRRRDGRIVESRRRHFKAELHFADEHGLKPRRDKRDELDLRSVKQLPISYPDHDPSSPIYHGPSLRTLRSLGFSLAQSENQSPIAVGTIVAPSPAHLFGEDRALSGWQTSPAVMDGVLYAAGMLAGKVGGRASLPVSVDRVAFGRLPVFGEPLQVIVRWEKQIGNDRGLMSATLVGQNGDRIAALDGYQIAWLPAMEPVMKSLASSQEGNG
ncbi:MAG: SDR family NAD(P)-dependent oxidoreductase [Planctomycetota bacterium]